MAGSPAAISPATPRAQEDNDLLKICEEMKTWLSGSPALKCVEATHGETKMKSSKSTTIDSSNAGSPSLDLPRAAPDAHAESERSTTEAIRKPKAATIPSKAPSKSSAEIQRKKSRLGTTSVTAQDGCDAPVGKQPEKTKSDRSSNSIPRAFTLLSDTPLPAPLHIIQAATAGFHAVKPRTVQSRHSWSVSNVCSTEEGYEHDTSPSFPIKQESDSEKVHVSVPEVEKKTAHGHTGSFLDYASAKGTQCFVGAWLTKFLALPSMTVPYKILCDESLVQCAIDTENGNYLAPIPQPETLRQMAEGPCRDYDDIGWRQANMTSELHIKREIKSREKIANALRVALEQLDHKAELLAGVGEEKWPEAKCVIRPAAPSDFAQIAEIINAEASNTGNAQFFQDKLATADDVCKIFDACTATSRPFIVVIPAQDDFLERSKWPKDSDEVYQEFAKYMAAKPKQAAPVAGFAFVSDYRMSVYGTPCPTSQYNGQVKLVVHADHRRKMYGSALMDRILLSVSPSHRSALDYVWKCDDPKNVYLFPVTHNTRQYTQLYLELFFASNDLKGYPWKADLLGKFGFQEIGYFKNAAVQIDDQQHDHWLNMVLWQSDITPTEKIVARPQFSGSAAVDN